MPPFLLFPIRTEWGQCRGIQPSLGAHSVPCPAAEHLIPMTAFLCNVNVRVPPVAAAVTASHASAAGMCPPRWPAWHRISVWASPTESPHMNQHRGVAALHQLNAMVSPRGMCVSLLPTYPFPSQHVPVLQKWSYLLGSICSLYPENISTLTPGFFYLAPDPTPLTFSSSSTLACSRCFLWSSVFSTSCLPPRQPGRELGIAGQLRWMGAPGAAGSRVEAQLH